MVTEPPAGTTWYVTVTFSIASSSMRLEKYSRYGPVWLEMNEKGKVGPTTPQPWIRFPFESASQNWTTPE